MESAEAMDLHEKSVVLGTAIDALTMGEVMARIEASLDTGRQMRIGVVNAAKLVNIQDDALLRDDVNSSDVVLADRRNFRVYCLGATEEVSATIEANLRRDYPGLIIAGRRNGYFGTDDEVAIAEAKPDMLLVAMTSPKKGNFMGRWSETMGVPVVHGVGGSFDVYAGLVERAPESWQNLGLEWLYRVKQEPGRLWKRYLVTNAKFIGRVLVDLVLRR